MAATIGEAITEALPQLQAAAVSLMVDECVVTRAGSGEWEPDPDTGYEVPPEPTVVYEGPCKVATYAPYESTKDIGGKEVAVQRYSIHTPVGAGPFEVGDVVDITVSANEPATLGREFRVAGLHEKTWQTAQRMFVDEVPARTAGEVVP